MTYMSGGVQTLALDSPSECLLESYQVEMNKIYSVLRVSSHMSNFTKILDQPRRGG